MPPGDPTGSLEPLLRARAQPGYQQPQLRQRTYRQTPNTDASKKDDFMDFLKGLGKLAVSPVTVPLKIAQKTITSPLTISLLLKLLLLGFLILSSAGFSILAVGAFWYSWSTGGSVEVEGWLVYGSKTVRTPHANIALPSEYFQEDLRYDVEVEMELVRPSKASEEMGNFMLTLQLLSAKNPETILIQAAQPCLPPPPLLTSSLPHIPLPCIIPFPFRFMCPSRLLGLSSPTPARRPLLRKGSIKNRAFDLGHVRSGDVVSMKKELMEGVLVNPSTSSEGIGSAFVSIGREDTFPDGTSTDSTCSPRKEVRTTGWVLIRFTPKPTGIRWLLSSHPIPPLLILPPISLALTLSSALIAFIVISYVTKSTKPPSLDGSGEKRKDIKGKGKSTATAEEMLEEKKRNVFRLKDQEERIEAERRQKEWEEVESLARGGLRKIPEGKKRSSVAGASTIGGSETTITAPSAIPSFSPIPEMSDDNQSVTESTVTESESGDVTATESNAPGRSRRTSLSGTSDGWEEAR